MWKKREHADKSANMDGRMEKPSISTDDFVYPHMYMSMSDFVHLLIVSWLFIVL